MARGYKFILASVKPDGGIYHQEDENYNTSICLMALLAAHKPEYDAVALRARQWIIGQQAGGKENTGSPFDGGVGYGSSATGPHTDMNNTYYRPGSPLLQQGPGEGQTASSGPRI